MAEKKDEHNRREFLTRTGHLVAGACGLAATAGAIRMALPDFGTGEETRFPLGRAADFKMNTLTWLRERDLFVLRDGTGVGALSAKCTHLGCTVRRTGEGFLCPCHGAVYDPLGEVLKGPSREPLPWYPVWIEADGRLWADTGTSLDTRGPRPLALPDKARR